jgi:hypothetical protein
MRAMMRPPNLETLAHSMSPGWATTVATMIGGSDTDGEQLCGTLARHPRL